jgi:hypothetical protein
MGQISDLLFPNIRRVLNRLTLIQSIKILMIRAKDKTVSKRQTHNLIKLEILQETITQQSSKQLEEYQL